MAMSPALAPKLLYDVKPDYFVYAGLVFTPLTQNHPIARGDNAPRKLIIILFEPALRSPGIIAGCKR
ncbi:MAG: hypothetical protein PHW60_13380 [Kiritimatiellae bacterium]|nr:hypothetical protein [Kiritimatiellia bacterium]